MGTPLWMAPEILLKKGYDNKCDIWSLGITIIGIYLAPESTDNSVEMADGAPPLSNMNPFHAMKIIPTMKPPTFSKRMKIERLIFIQANLKLGPPYFVNSPSSV